MTVERGFAGVNAVGGVLEIETRVEDVGDVILVGTTVDSVYIIVVPETRPLY